MHKLLRLARRRWLESQRTSVRERVPIANRPLARFALVLHAEVTVPVDKIRRGITPFFERPKNLRAGRGPIARRDRAFETKRPQIRVSLGIKFPLRFEQKRR